MKKMVMALCASFLVNLINPAGPCAWGMAGLVAGNGGKQAETIRAEQAGQSDSLSVQVQAPSLVLMEASTGQTIYEKNADERRSPASITKIMTLILIFDAIDEGKIRLSDEVVTSAHAKSMGGSQVFLEEGEVQTVETLIKCIVIASGNDASVAMAEYIAGSEDAFVQSMNERAKGLGMTGTHFVDCCGLTESPEHLTTARDIAIMSRELITKYPQIHNYSTIWMENITHVTKQGTKEFGLANTNKLLKMATNFKADCRDHGGTGLQGTLCGCPGAFKLWIRQLPSVRRPGDAGIAADGCGRWCGAFRFASVRGRILLFGAWRGRFFFHRKETAATGNDAGTGDRRRKSRGTAL